METKTRTLSSVAAATIRAEAARRGLTQTDLAGRLEMSKMAVSDRYRERTPWTLDEVERVAGLFGLEVAELLARPKGFEPLTFWLGASHTVTVFQTSRGWACPWFCDECGRDGFGAQEAWEHVEFAELEEAELREADWAAADAAEEALEARLAAEWARA